MSERRSLIEGIKPKAPPIDPSREKAFVYGDKEPMKPDSVQAAPALSKAPLSTRIRADFAAALKRASLERQLAGKEPHTLQDILEQAIEPWLKTNGYLP